MSKKILGLVAFSIMIAACSGPPPQDDADTTARAEPAATGTDSGPDAATSFPGNIALTLDHRVLSDEVFERDGEAIRRIMVEFTASDPLVVVEQLKRDVEAAGFEASEPKVRPDERVGISFERNENERVRAITMPVTGEGVVLKIDWPAAGTATSVEGN